MVLVSLPKKLRLYRNLQRFYGSDTNGLVETRGVKSLTIVSHTTIVIYDCYCWGKIRVSHVG